MSRRLELHTILESIPGVKGVYFQPPPTVQLVFPAIIYSKARPETKFADNKLYIHKPAYQIMVVDPDPDGEIGMRVIELLPMARFERHYTSDLLNHEVYHIYY